MKSSSEMKSQAAGTMSVQRSARFVTLFGVLMGIALSVVPKAPAMASAAHFVGKDAQTVQHCCLKR